MDEPEDHGAGELVAGTAGALGVEHEATQLRDRLAEIEVEQATLEAELAAFHSDYMRQVGVVMARVHELEARILRTVASRSGAPGDARAAADAEARARTTTDEVGAVPEPGGPPPTEDLKKLFRDAAKLMHPDIAGDDEARAHAEAFMKRLNQAYRAGEAAAIRDLVLQWEASPYAPAPDASAAREIARMRAAVERAERRLEDVRGSQLADMMERSMASAATGGDFLAEMRAAAEQALAAAQARLAALGAETRQNPAP